MRRGSGDLPISRPSLPWEKGPLVCPALPSGHLRWPAWERQPAAPHDPWGSLEAEQRM